ncbi:putative ubiquitin-conjugating enzyme E2 38 [Papaver somniferum]|uniref:putative ubiquitin-conjugating enzyme E2 38 n=1 Tax=Papaver somniferum TaxID=3469 RepID=UPI000E6F521F|nr:putative ubiquitin-conjugating enzyme E2 38 [Papaver somniferum]
MENPQNQEMVEIRVDVEGSKNELEKKEKNTTNFGRKGRQDEEVVIQIRVEGKDREAEKEKEVEKVRRKEFKQFDIVKSTAQVGNKAFTSDEHLNQTSLDRHNRIMQEWKLLKKGLPDSIYVRVHEQRTDFLEALIVGGAGTPYSDGLFYFHIIFPSNYPLAPPTLHFKTTYYCDGLGVDFLKYNDCEGIYIRDIKGLEKWNSKDSSILEILVSIRLSFHIEKPYFRNHNMNDRGLLEAIEKGYKFDESYDFDEMVFKRKCGTVLATLKKPPKVFEEFVAQHFRDRAEAILIACQPYYRVRYGDRPIYETKFCRKYRESMANTYVKLLKAFIKNGSSVDDYVGDINLVDDSDYVKPPPTLPPWICTDNKVLRF